MLFNKINLEFIKGRFGTWLTTEDKNSDIVISSRIRLARNLASYPFPHVAPEDKLKEIQEKIKKNSLSLSCFSESFVVDMENLSPLEKQLLQERHLISKELAKNKYASLIVNKDEYIALMINEEDHIRLCVLTGGIQLENSWLLASKLEDDLSTSLDFAVSSEIGYLTACPTNVGTGMRASVMLHLLGLVLTKQIHKIISEMTKLGVAIRGIYGEGTEGAGEIFQISNQVTLGRREEDFIEQVTSISKQLVSFEREIRQNLYKQQPAKVEDRVFRAYSIFKNARIITSKEALELLSFIRLGISLGIIKDISISTLNHLLILTQPAHVQLYVGAILSTPQRDIKRATLIQEYLAEIQAKSKKDV